MEYDRKIEGPRVDPKTYEENFNFPPLKISDLGLELLIVQDQSVISIVSLDEANKAIEEITKFRDKLELKARIT